MKTMCIRIKQRDICESLSSSVGILLPSKHFVVGLPQISPILLRKSRLAGTIPNDYPVQRQYAAYLTFLPTLHLDAYKAVM